MTDSHAGGSATSAQIERETCPVCGGGGPFSLFAEASLDASQLGDLAFASRKAPELMHHRLVVCPTCDLLFANPIPPVEAVEKAYAEASFDSAEEARCASRTYARLIDKIRNDLPDQDGALDIGTGEGSFLDELAGRGFRSLVGVEPSAAPVAAANPETRKLIREEPFNPGAFPEDSFALITCFQTLEHVFEPSDLVRDAYRLLKPGGAFVAVCHNRRALSARILGMKSPIFDIEHMQLFSRRSAAALLDRAGYERVRVSVILNRYPITYWSKLLPLPGGRGETALERLRRSRLGRTSLALPAGNQVLVGFKPAR